MIIRTPRSTTLRQWLTKENAALGISLFALVFTGLDYFAGRAAPDLSLGADLKSNWIFSLAADERRYECRIYLKNQGNRVASDLIVSIASVPPEETLQINLLPPKAFETDSKYGVLSIRFASLGPGHEVQILINNLVNVVTEGDGNKYLLFPYLIHATCKEGDESTVILASPNRKDSS
jgi:hypothetical protein